MSIRVALVCPYSLDVPGGVGTHVLGLAGWLARRGHRPLVIAPGTRPAPVPDGVDLELVGGAIGLPFNGSVANLALSPGQSRRARSLARDADVVHVHEPLTPGIAHAVAREADRLVVTHHASFRVPAAAGVLLRPWAGALGTRESLAVSEAAATTARAVTGTAPAIVPNAIELPEAPGPRLGWGGGDRPRVGFLGRADEPRKGFPVFRELASLAAPGEAEFVAAGPAGRSDPGRVRLLGRLEALERQEFLAGVDVLVAPNLHGESFGMVIVEALAAGCDVVASDQPAFSRVLAEAGVGATFPTGSAHECLRVLRTRFAAPVDPRAAHAAAARWSWDRVGPLVLEAYGRVRPSSRLQP